MSVPTGSGEPTQGDVQAAFAATLVDEWVRGGVAHAVVCPGSRSTPLAVALAAHPDVTVHVRLDERSAGFSGLGLGLASGRPAVVLTTSGTAAAELHPAVVEADLAVVPLLVCTADRPPELRDVGAPQTIDQVHLYGRSPRWFADPGVPDPATSKHLAFLGGPVGGGIDNRTPWARPGPPQPALPGAPAGRPRGRWGTPTRPVRWRALAYRDRGRTGS